MAKEFPLEPDLIDVLASETRREILRHLREQHRTVTELSREIDLRKATIHEHLKKLVNAGLVEREEDDRVWVYYRLTPRGKRLLSPNRTRFYLAIAVSAFAAIVAVAALAFYLSAGPLAGGGDEMDQSADFEATSGDLEDAYSVYSGDGVRIETDTGLDPGDRAYLVEASLEDQVQRGDPSVEGIPLHQETAQQEGGTMETEDAAGTPTSASAHTILLTDAPLSPGSYNLFVRGDAGDNRDSMPEVHVTTLQAETSHQTWWTGASEDLEATLHADEDPLEGHIFLEPRTQGAPTHSVPLEDGHARFDADQLDGLPPGAYGLVAAPEDADGRIEIETIRIQAPTLTVAPQILPAGESTELNVTLTGQGAPLEAPVRVTGQVLDEDAEGATGHHLAITPARAGTLEVHAGRQASTSLDVQPAFQGTLFVEDGPQHALELAHADGTPAGDVAIRLDGEGIGFTSQDGTLAMDQLPEGAHTLSLQGATGLRVTQELRVDGWDVEPVEPSLDVTRLTDRTHPDQVGLELRETSGVPAQGTLSVTVDGTLLHAAPYELDPNGFDRFRAELDATDQPERHVQVTADPFDPASIAFENRTSAEDADGQSGQAPSEGGLVETFTLGGAFAAMEQVPEDEDAVGGPEADSALPSRSQPLFGSSDAAQAPDATQEETPLPALAALLAAMGGALVLRRRG